MKKFIMIVVLVCSGDIYSNQSSEVTEKVPSFSFSAMYNIAQCAIYFYRIGFLVDAFEKKVSKLSKDEKSFLVCVNCNKSVPAKNILSEFVADTLEALYDSNMFSKYCKVIDKMLAGMKACDYQAFTSCALDVVKTQEKVCEQCGQFSWKVIQKKDLQIIDKKTSNDDLLKNQKNP